MLIAEVLLLAGFYIHRAMGIAGTVGFPLDDSWIHSTFARNLAEGKGMVYNIDQPASSTTILYTLLLGLAFKIRMSPVLDAIVIGLCLHIMAS